MAQAPSRVQTLNPEPAAQYQRQFTEDFTVYELDFLGLAAGTSANGSVQIQADSAFKWTKACYYADIDAAAFQVDTQPVPNVSITIQDSGSGRSLFNLAVPVPSIFGFGTLPFILPIPRIFLARSSMAVTVQNFDAAATYNLRLSFIGTKLFQM